ncbi:MAG: protein translocase subunit SecD, partial [Gammaproteobacteria bacterium]
MNRYPLWKNLLVVAVILVGLLLAIPNLYGDDPALQITREDGSQMSELTVSGVRATLEEQEIDFLEAALEGDAAIVRFPDVERQLRGSDVLGEALPLHVVALTLAPRTPPLLRMLGLKPMSLGLDLRGGVHFLYQVDLESALRQFLESYEA